MNYNVRIDDNFLRGDHVDGEVLQHTDLNELENVTKTAINANYEDIQKLQDGTILIGNSEKLSGATLSTFAEETLQSSDSKVPTAMQTKQYVDAAISNIDLGGYYTKRETDDILEEHYYTKAQNITCLEGAQGTPVDVFNLAVGLYLINGYAKFGSNIEEVDKELIGVYEDAVYDFTAGHIFDVENNYNVYNFPTGGDIYTLWEFLTYKKDENLNLLPAHTYILDGDNFTFGEYDEDSFHGFFYISTYDPIDNIREIVNLSTGEIQRIQRTSSGGTYIYEDAGYDYLMTERDVISIQNLEYYYTSAQIDNLMTNMRRYVDNAIASIDLSNYYTKQETNTFLYEKAAASDLTDYVKNTDYAGSTGGVIKAGSAYNDYSLTNDGYLRANVRTYEQYQADGNNSFIGKGTLENVITGKGLTTKSYVDGLVGDIGTALDAINGEVI